MPWNRVLISVTPIWNVHSPSPDTWWKERVQVPTIQWIAFIGGIKWNGEFSKSHHRPKKSTLPVVKKCTCAESKTINQRLVTRAGFPTRRGCDTGTTARYCTAGCRVDGTSPAQHLVRRLHFIPYPTQALSHGERAKGRDPFKCRVFTTVTYFTSCLAAPRSFMN
jgi:hypothetical protein